MILSSNLIIGQALFNDYLNIDSVSKIKIFTYEGKLMFESLSFNDRHIINTAHYSSGVFFVKMSYKDRNT